MTSSTQLTLAQLNQGTRTDLNGHYGVIRAVGADARSFLHAQLTQDVISLAANETKLGGYCNAKGRLFAILQIAVKGEDVYLLTRRDVIDMLVKRLRMFVLRAKVTLDDVSDEFDILGLAGQNGVANHQATLDGDTLRLGVMPAKIDGQSIAREIVLQPKNTAESIADRFDISQNAWQWLDIMAGLPHVEASTVEAFVPQMLNLDRIGGVNFKKGCYPGQEIVARSHYLGKLKRRMLAVRFTFADANSAHAALSQLAAKTDIHSRSDASQPAGVIVTAAVNLIESHQVDALIEVSLPMLDDGATLSVGGVEAKVERLELPYALSDKTD